MTSLEYILLLGVGALVAYALMRMFTKAVDTQEKETAPVLFWVKPEPGDDLPADAIKFMQVTKECPFCHSPLLNGPRGGSTQNFSCSNYVCNSRFNIMPLPPDHPNSFPFGQYMGANPEDVLIEIRERQVAKAALTDIDDRWPSL